MECWYVNCVMRKDGCASSCARLSQMLFLMESAELPKNLRKPIPLIPDECDVEAFDELDRIRHDAKGFVAKGGSLFICGNVTGNGKTSWSVKIMQNYFNQIWSGNNYAPRGLFVSVPYLLALVSRGFSDSASNMELGELVNKAVAYDLVVWDDVACTELTKSQQNVLQGIIDARINAGLANVYNGNMLDAPLRQAVGQRLFSRIQTNSRVVVLRGRDMRNGAIADNQ